MSGLCRLTQVLPGIYATPQRSDVTFNSLLVFVTKTVLEGNKYCCESSFAYDLFALHQKEIQTSA